MPKALYTMVGMKYQNADGVVASLQKGEAVTLIRDANNPHDPNAVQVHARDMHVAYIVAAQAIKLAKRMDLAGVKSLPARYAITSDGMPMVEVEE